MAVHQNELNNRVVWYRHTQSQNEADSLMRRSSISSDIRVTVFASVLRSGDVRPLAGAVGPRSSPSSAAAGPCRRPGAHRTRALDRVERRERGTRPRSGPPNGHGSVAISTGAELAMRSDDTPSPSTAQEAATVGRRSKYNSAAVVASAVILLDRHHRLNI